MNHFKLVFITFLLFSSMHLVAQSDFRQGHLITLKGDTLTGLIDYQSDNKLCKRCRFKASKADRVKAFNPAELKGFQFDKEGR